VKNVKGILIRTDKMVSFCPLIGTLFYLLQPRSFTSTEMNADNRFAGQGGAGLGLLILPGQSKGNDN
jgi:hypothetical protein